ncbi:hypothetical protein [Ramlibacter sp. WS9]|uniref:hypothetical protein n=1 Tax=Ramlibacter sp. WS9 TaxID=1882741 RepID=UPI001141F467|nr:hypothetical protein [Ramlibacter sp. WS9]ROZ72083.1 hypothetical protein EEB15_20095 [Ramlibacter sp. WS9]
MHSNTAKDLCEKLIHEDSEAEVIALLKNAGYWDNPACWRYYGDNELNWSQAGGQQGRADFALNEKNINSIDSVLTLKCLLEGIDPEGPTAPKSIREAVAKFIEHTAKLTTSGGRVEDWPVSFRTKVAENISVFTTEAPGSKSSTKPSVNIADLGEGHTPEAFPDTLVSLGKRNKASVPFVQGKFCQGGSGAIRHCGNAKLQLIVSRRHPKLIGAPNVSANYPKHESDDCWGFTIVRREEATATSKIPVLTYLAPLGADTEPRKGGVLRFKAPTMPLFPKGDVAYKRDVESGTLIKLYAYQLKSTGNIIRRDGLLYKLDLLLPDPALPIRMHECRKRAHGVGEKGASEQSTTMAGLFARLQKSDNLEDTPPMSMPITIQGKQIIARVFAFKPTKAATYRSNEGVIFTVNGQAHADIKATIFARKRVGLQRLARDLLVVVDCSTLDANQRDDLFMSSRDRVAEESPLFTELERNLEDALHEHPGLRELRNKRAQQDLQEQLSDNKPLESVLKHVLKSSPALAKLFGKGERLSTPFKPEKVQPDPAPPKLHSHPTYFHFTGKEPGVELKRAAHMDQKCRVIFATDAEDAYFTRKYDPGVFKFHRLTDGQSEPIQSFNGPNLVRGRATISFDLPASAKPGDTLIYEMIVEDEIMQRTFKNVMTLLVAPAMHVVKSTPSVKPPPPGSKPGPVPDGEGGIALPTVIRLKKSDPKWAEHFSDENSCLDLIEDISEVNGKSEISYMFYLNEDNLSLQTELKASKSNAQVLLKQFEVGAVLIGMGLIHEHLHKKPGAAASDEKDAEANLQDHVRVFSRAVAPVLLPMIQTLGELGEDDLDESDLAGLAETNDVDAAVEEVL